MHPRALPTLLTLIVSAVITGTSVAAAAESTLGIDADDIGGVVTDLKGPEAGVWVIAETQDLPTRFARIVVTDEKGRYVVPDLPKAKYKLWVRGYGLVDSTPVDGTPGSLVNLTATPAPSPREAAEYYPADYWLSLLKVPPENDFPGTGPNGNGIAPAMLTQQDWVAHTKEQCQFCHQLGTKVTRTLPDIGNSVEAWDLRVQKARYPDDPFNESEPGYKPASPLYGAWMSNNMTLFGRHRGLQMFADWTDRIKKGELPLAPPRPLGVERNLVLSMWDWGGGRFIHDSSSSDKRNPTVNANGPVYGVETTSGRVISLDPSTGKTEEFRLTNLKGQPDYTLVNHTSTIDGKGRLWMSTIRPSGQEDAFCNDGNLSPYAKYYPHPVKGGHTVGVFDPKTGKNELVPTCFMSHHLAFATGGVDRLYFTGEIDVVGWVDTKVWDTTHDAAKSVGWCPLVVDTNGDGKIDSDRTRWQELKEAGNWGGEGLMDAGKDGKESMVRLEQRDNRASLDPKKDTRIVGFNYATGVSPVDNTYWAAKYSPLVPSGILRVDPGAHPPESCKTEYYEAPKIRGQYAAFNSRGLDVDADGVAWVAFGSGSIASFDRRKCKVLNGPTATGQQCPEGWTIIDQPGPKLAGTQIGADWAYLTFADNFDTSGLGKMTPFFPGSNSDEILAYRPKQKQFVHLRVPYPMGFYARGVDGRIDDPKAGWKGRALWSTSAVVPVWHEEGGEGSTEYMVKFQIRPDPLAH